MSLIRIHIVGGRRAVRHALASEIAALLQSINIGCELKEGATKVTPEAHQRRVEAIAERRTEVEIDVDTLHAITVE